MESRHGFARVRRVTKELLQGASARGLPLGAFGPDLWAEDLWAEDLWAEDLWA